MNGRVNAVPASVLYSSARVPEDMLKARSADADVWLVDLEDSVPPTCRTAARQAVYAFLASGIDLCRTAVRINPLSTADYCADVTMLLAQDRRPAFVFMTMVDDAAEVRCLRAAFDGAGWRPRIYATIETASGVANVRALAAELDGMILGSADLAASLGVDISAVALRGAREAMALAAAETGTGCIDTGNFLLGNPEALAAEITEARALGFHGKGTVHPKELQAINAAFRPDPETIRQAHRVCDAHSQANGGVCMLDGQMIGPPFVRLAKARLARAQSWKETFGEGQ